MAAVSTAEGPRIISIQRPARSRGCCTCCSGSCRRRCRVGVGHARIAEADLLAAAETTHVARQATSRGLHLVRLRSRGLHNVRIGNCDAVGRAAVADDSAAFSGERGKKEKAMLTYTYIYTYIYIYIKENDKDRAAVPTKAVDSPAVVLPHKNAKLLVADGTIRDLRVWLPSRKDKILLSSS